ncbi:hypothetical protein IFM89_019618 [Coptis chinensis]|uniref:Translation initiation factor IF-3 n=1 Tax=Coptis chinensis TaxID=261450 RepID=A0A835IB84_9MAGN|nr:hypothetical protein IFM89_019618 [Coptis chinensis]
MMDVCRAEQIPFKQVTEEVGRLPLGSSEKNVTIVRRPKTTRDVQSRYKTGVTSSSLSTPVAPRRSQSPSVTRTVPSTTPSYTKRAQSAERRRPSTPPSPPAPATPVNDASLEMQTNSKRLPGGRNSEGLWPSVTVRSLCVSFQSDTFSLPVTRKEKPASHSPLDHTLKPSSNFAHRQVETPNVQRKGTPERKRTPLRGRNAADQSENSKPVDNSHGRMIDQHLWPSRMGGKVSTSPSTMSVNHTDKTGKAFSSPLIGRGVSPLRRSPVADGSGRGLQKAHSELASRLSFDESAGVQHGLFATEDALQSSGLHKFSSYSVAERAASTTRTKFQSLPVPGSHSSRPASPSRTTLPSSSSTRGTRSPSRTRPSAPFPSGGSTTTQSSSSSSVLSFITDYRRGKKGANHIEDAHQLRLLYNGYLQWRFTNAQAYVALTSQRITSENTLYNVWNTISELWGSVTIGRIELQQVRQELKLGLMLNEQMVYLEDWALLEGDHSCSLSAAIESLEACTLRLPITGGAKADIVSLNNAVCSAADVMQAMCSSTHSLLSRVQGTNSLVTELADVIAQERAMVDECRDLLASAAAMQFDSSTLSNVLPAVAELQELKIGMKIQCMAMKRGFHDDGFVLTGLVSLYSKCRDIDSARFLFEQISRPDLVSWNAMISGYSSNGEMDCAVEMFRKLVASGGVVNSSTVVGLIPVFCPFGNLNLSRCIHGFSVKTGIDFNTSVCTALITVYSRLNEIESARQLFEGAPEENLVSWNAMISCYAQNGLTEKAIALFKQMQNSEVKPNPVTVTSILSACAQLGALRFGKWVHELVVRENFQSNIFVSTALVDMYAKCGSIKEAQDLFDSMPEKNVVSWNAMICGYGLHGLGREALGIYEKMLHSGLFPTGVTFLSVLYACSHAGLVSEGEKIYQSMAHYGIQARPEQYACMVDLLGRAGKLEKALQFINEMPVDPGPAEWGALLGACMIHKNKHLAQVASDHLFKLDTDNVGYHVLLSNIYSADQNYPAAAVVRQTVRKKKLVKTPGCTLIELGETLYIFTSGDKSNPQSVAIYAELEKLTAKMREAGFKAETEMAFHDVEEEEKEQMVNVHSEKLAIAFALINTKPETEIRIIKNLRVCLDCHNATKFISKITERVIVVRDANRFHHFKDGICSCGDFCSNLSPPFKLVSQKKPTSSFASSLSWSSSNSKGYKSESLSLITARYGRPSFNRSRDSSRKRNEPAEADPAVDVSTIRSPSVRLIDAQQNMVGVVSKGEAIRMAEEAELDLVILSPDADPPVVKIMDYNKYKYEQQKKKKEQQKKSSASRMDMKELKMGYNIDVHDYTVRLKAAQKFLNDGDKVKVIVQLKGRENEFRNIAIELIKRFQNDIGELGTEEAKNFRERNIFLVLLPNKAIQQRIQEQPKRKEKSVTDEALEKKVEDEVSANV